jgi:NTE family protein
MTAPAPQQKKIGLALGSGGARGWAHLGVLQRLSELGIVPHCVAGTSIGSIAAALYATDSLATMEDLATHLDWKRVAQLFLEVKFPRSGLLTGKNFIHMLKSIIPVRQIEDLRLPYAAVATDLETEKEVVLCSGNLFDAIRASIGIPGIFTPTRLSGKYLVDGGLVNPLPVSVCRAMGADLVIAVDINLRAAPHTRKLAKPQPAPPEPSVRITQLIATLGKLMPQMQAPMEDTALRWLTPKTKSDDALTIFDVLTRSFRLAENQITRRELELNPPDLLIQPEVGNIMTLEFHRGPEAIAAGIRAVNECLPLLHSFLPTANR